MPSSRHHLTATLLGIILALLVGAGCASTETRVEWDPSEQPIGEILGHEPDPVASNDDVDTVGLPTPANSDIGIYCLPGAQVVEALGSYPAKPDDVADLHADASYSLRAFRLQAGRDLWPAIDRVLWAIAEREFVLSNIGFDETRLSELDGSLQGRFADAFDAETFEAIAAIGDAVALCPAVVDAGGVVDLGRDWVRTP